MATLAPNKNGKRGLALPSPSPSPSGSNSNIREGSIAAAAAAQRSAVREGTIAAAAAAAASQQFGSQMGTQIMYAIDFLKSKGVAKTLQEVLEHLTMQHMDEEQKKLFARKMQENGRITFTPAPRSSSSSSKGAEAATAWRAGLYEFRPKIPGVTSKETLLEHLQRRTDASCIDVKELKDGWPDCDDAITELERDHKILVVRTKKDSVAKYIWLDNPPLFHPVDAEFRTMWARVQLPAVDDMVRKLREVGQKPSSEEPKKVVAPKGKQVKRRVNRNSKKQTNEHMASILQDYSHLKRG